MADTISISTRHGIKCYGKDIKVYDTCSYTAKTTRRKINQLTGDGWLWTEESVDCICTHHVEQHCTVRDRNGSVLSIHCHGNNERCNCELFRTRSIRLLHGNGGKPMMEASAIV